MCELKKWLCDNHNISVEVYRCSSEGENWPYGCTINQWQHNETINEEYNNYFRSSKDALEEGNFEALKLIKKTPNNLNKDKP